MKELNNRIAMIPSKNKCWQNLKGHKFINTNGKEGLPIYIVNNENQKFIFSKTYKEVDI